MIYHYNYSVRRIHDSLGGTFSAGEAAFPKSQLTATATGYQNSLDQFRPSLALDGLVTKVDTGFWHSPERDLDFLKVDLGSVSEVTRVEVVSRLDCCFWQYSQVQVRAGLADPPDLLQPIAVNADCGTQGDEDTTYYNYVCTNDPETRYVTVQRLALFGGSDGWAVNEIFVFRKFQFSGIVLDGHTRTYQVHRFIHVLTSGLGLEESRGLDLADGAPQSADRWFSLGARTNLEGGNLLPANPGRVATEVQLLALNNTESTST